MCQHHAQSDKAHIYTDDKEALLEYASQLGDRQSALELTQTNIRNGGTK
ncbi:MAG: hypothetical protein IPJ79_06865 [Bacteroidetes bacterium]|nr:hypothetical protein [Bacteroidota bacterium]